MLTGWAGPPRARSRSQALWNSRPFRSQWRKDGLRGSLACVRVDLKNRSCWIAGYLSHLWGIL